MLRLIHHYVAFLQRDRKVNYHCKTKASSLVDPGWFVAGWFDRLDHFYERYRRSWVSRNGLAMALLFARAETKIIQVGIYK